MGAGSSATRATKKGEIERAVAMGRSQLAKNQKQVASDAFEMRYAGLTFFPLIPGGREARVDKPRGRRAVSQTRRGRVSVQF